MGKKHSLLKTAVAATAALYATNTAIDYHAKEKNLCSSAKGQFYDFKYGDIYYQVQGEGSPLLLIHNLDTISSGYEWSKILKKLEKTHKVYTLDLLGCGQSDKPSLTYTNFLFVQLITSFVRDVICEKTSIVASADASSIAIMANQMDPNLFNEIILINPSDIHEMKMETNNLDMTIKNILFAPLIGTTLYNFYVSEEHIRSIFQKKYLSYPLPENKKFIDLYYQSAHINKSNGRFLYASKKCSYTNVDVTKAIAEKNNLHIIESTDRKKAIRIAEDYKKYNSKIDITYISNSKLLPMLEVPEQCLKIIYKYLA